jgi:nucleotide-binding universal stress UspA family protein
MSIRTVSLVVSDESRDTSPLRAAASIALRERAHLDVYCLAAEFMSIVPTTWMQSPVLTGVEQERTHVGASALASWARSMLPRELRATVQPLRAPNVSIAAVTAQATRLSDLIVTGRPYGPGHGPLASMIAEALLFGTGAPVLVVPDQVSPDWSRPFQRMCLAWNDSDEVLRATRAALPFLKAAQFVDIVVIDPDRPSANYRDLGRGVSAWLARHDVRAEVTVVPRRVPREADILSRFALERGCEAMVLGAFGHSRLRETILGGVTHDLLAHVPLPLVMAH